MVDPQALSLDPSLTNKMPPSCLLKPHSACLDWAVSHLEFNSICFSWVIRLVTFSCLCHSTRLSHDDGDAKFVDWGSLIAVGEWAWRTYQCFYIVISEREERAIALSKLEFTAASTPSYSITPHQEIYTSSIASVPESDKVFANVLLDYDEDTGGDRRYAGI